MRKPRFRAPNEPDLFSRAVATRSTVEVAPPKPAPLLLPEDLARSLEYLSDADLLRLKSAAEDEAARRHLRVQPPARDARLALLPKPKTLKERDVQKSALPAALAKVIRSAIKAGVKPKVVARQFGVSLEAVQKALVGKDD